MSVLSFDLKVDQTVETMAEARELVGAFMAGATEFVIEALAYELIDTSTFDKPNCPLRGGTTITGRAVR